MNASLILTSSRKNTTILLPYDCMNLIFEYLSQILDSNWSLVFDSNGRIHMRVNKYASLYTNILQLNRYKMEVSRPKYLMLRVFHRFPDEMAFEVGALEQPRRIYEQAKIDEDFQNGYIDFAWCYSYTNPLTSRPEYIYTSARYYIANNHGVFLGGTLLRDGSAYNVTEYVVNESVGLVSIGISQLNLDWGEEEVIE